MKANNLFTLYRDGIRHMNHSVRCYMLASFLQSMVLGANDTIYNLYLKSLGFSNALLGELESLRFLAALLFTLVCGIISDRIGRKRALILGSLMTAGCLGFRIFCLNPLALQIASFLFGIATSLIFISGNPLLAEEVAPEYRMQVFSLNSVLYVGAGIFGYSFGGIFPDLLIGRGWLESDAQRTTLIAAALLFSLSLLPLFFMKGHRRSEQTDAAVLSAQPSQGFLQMLRRIPRSDLSAILRNALPIAFSSAGAALALPLFSVFLSSRHQVSSSTIGLIMSLGELSIVIATILSPILAQRLGLVKAVSLLQLVSIPFLLLMGHAHWLGFVVLGYLLRGAAMNAANPLQGTLQMNIVSEPYRGFASSCIEMAGSLGRSLCSGLGGTLSQLRGFPFVYSLAALFYGLATFLYYVLNRRYDRAGTATETTPAAPSPEAQA